MGNLFKKIDFITLILLIILIIVLYCYAQLKIFDKEYINLGGYTMFQVITGSMEPTIKVKDIVIEKITQDASFDEIITYRSGDDFVTHRVVGKTHDGFITKGDANNSDDNPIKKEDVIGKVVLIIPNVAIWTEVLKEPKVIIAIMLAIIMINLMFSKHKKDIPKEKIKSERG